MTQTLIKITDDHYVVVDDSPIKEGDWTYNIQSKTIFIATNSLVNLINSPNVVLTTNKKITHSTQPFEYSPKIWKYWSNVQPVSLSEVKELIGGVDVDKKAEEVYPQTYYSGIHIDGFLKAGYVKGYNQAIEDNKEKKYTEKDIIGFYYWLKKNYGSIKPLEEGQIRERTTDIGILNKYIQSLQPKTEWDVEFIDGNIKLK